MTSRMSSERLMYVFHLHPGSTGVILGQNFVRFSDLALDDLFFFKNSFYQKQFKYAMNIGLAQIGGALL